MFTFKTKSFIFLYLEGLKKQNTMTSWWEGQGIDCDKKTNLCFLVPLTELSSSFGMRDTEFSFCTGSHNHVVGSAEDFSVGTVCLTFTN